jgi:hypothetical protein
MSSPIPIELIGIGLTMLFAASLLGYFFQKGCGVVLVMGAAALASGLCATAYVLAGWSGLLAAIFVVGLMGAGIGNKLGRRRGAGLVSLLWLGFCLSCFIGNWVGGRFGLLTVTLPANVLFWTSLYVFSGFVLPLRDSSQHVSTFRSLLTFSLGTNYPYYVMKDRELEPRVEGNPYRSFLSGPGIVITGCDHAVVITDGRNIKVPEEPGLTFTERYEVIQRIVDLRPQLRTFHVEALTLDGISMRVLTFIPFRIHWGGQKPALGKSFPFQRRAILQAVTSEVVEQQQDQKHKWDELVQIHATRIMRDIISHYKFDDLCLAMRPQVDGVEDIRWRYSSDEEASPQDPERDPRYRIRNELVSRMKKEMKAFGIEVLGGGISNLLPVDEQVNKQRIKNWRTRWESHITLVRAEGDAKRARLVKQAQLDVEQDLLTEVSKMLRDSIAQGEDMSEELLAAAVVACLEQMAGNPYVGGLLPQDTRQKLAYLRGMGKPLLPSASPSEVAGESNV